MNVSLATVVALLAWIALALALTTRAEAAAGSRSTRRARAVACVCATLATAAALARPAPTRFACAAACGALVIAAFADARTGYLFDAVTFPTALLTASLATLGGGAHDAALGVLLLVGGFGALVALSRGRLMGLGDVKAMYAIGAAFGPYEALVAVFGACACGIATAALAGRLRRGSEIRFGPHLAAGSVFALVAGDPIVHGVLGL
jgi:prepilin signal peptidase PulO-like enzyme (type II secretory pathway)